MHFPKRQLSLFREGFYVTRSYRYRNQIKKGAEVPEGRVFLKYRSLLIRNLALELARLEREDDIAVAELVALIAWHRRDAEVAALDLRYDNNHHEQHLFNLAHRLLQAAITTKRLAQPTEADAKLIVVVEHLRGLPTDAMFRELAVKEPRLNEIKTQVRAGELGPRMHRLDEYIERHKLLSERLHGLVGPEAESNDLALRSYFAQINVRDYLLRVR